MEIQHVRVRNIVKVLFFTVLQQMRILESRVELHRPYNNAWSHLLQYRISGLRRHCLLTYQRCGKLLHKSDLNSIIKIHTLQPCTETIFC
jgi:hypothetical protein